MQTLSHKCIFTVCLNIEVIAATVSLNPVSSLLAHDHRSWPLQQAKHCDTDIPQCIAGASKTQEVGQE